MHVVVGRRMLTLNVLQNSAAELGDDCFILFVDLFFRDTFLLLCIRASLKVCQILLGKYYVSSTSKKICQVKKRAHLQPLT
jgi:hypothetical protein